LHVKQILYQKKSGEKDDETGRKVARHSEADVLKSHKRNFAATAAKVGNGPEAAAAPIAAKVRFVEGLWLLDGCLPAATNLTRRKARAVCGAMGIVRYVRSLSELGATVYWC
jgi:hypothetical protein